MFAGLFKNKLAGEVKAWCEDGIITPQQAEQIGGRYGIDVDNPEAQSLAYRVLVTLGYLFIGLALIVLIGANWDEIPRFVRMAALIVLTVCTQIFGLQHIKRGDDNSGVGLIFLGNLFFGASIILIAQIYHLGEHMPDGIFWWALGCLPFAVLLRSNLLMFQCLVLATVWFGLEISFDTYKWTYVLFLLAACYVLWRTSGNRLLAVVTSVAGAVWLCTTVGYYIESAGEVFFALILYCLATGVACQWWAGRGDRAVFGVADAVNTGVLCGALLLLLILSFEEPWRGFIPLPLKYPMFTIAAVVAVCLACACVALMTRRIYPFLIVSLFIVVVSVMLIYPDIDPSSKLAAGYTDNFATVMKTISGVALFLSGVLLVHDGISRSRSTNFYLGIVAILASAWARYFDLVGNYIGGAILFIICALILLFAARYWKSHNMQSGVPV